MTNRNLKPINFGKGVHIWTNGKGGVGKTTGCETAIELCLTRGMVPAIAQVDKQGRLSALNQSDVLTIAIDPKALRENPNLELGRFSALSDFVVDAPEGAPVFIDTGANEEGRFAYWCRQAEFTEDLHESGRQAYIYVVYTCEQEALEKAGEAARVLLASIPGASLCLVENERFGKIAELVVGTPAHQAYCRNIKPYLRQAHFIRMPRITGNSYAHFEQSRLPFYKIGLLSSKEAMQVTGLNRADARMARGDVGEWLKFMFNEYDRVSGVTTNAK